MSDSTQKPTPAPIEGLGITTDEVHNLYDLFAYSLREDLLRSLRIHVVKSFGRDPTNQECAYIDIVYA